MHGVLSPVLLEHLRPVHVAPDRMSARVGDRELEAASPRELRRLLSNALYEVLHAGQDEHGVLPLRIRDADFEAVLGAAVPHQETVLPGVLVQPAEDDEDGSRCLVELAGVRVWVPAARVVEGHGLAVGGKVSVLNTAHRPALSPGFFLVDGTHLPRHRDVLRVYVHLAQWSAAAGAWHRALAFLEDRRVAYRAKVLSVKQLYPRRDALVVYLDPVFRYCAEELADALSGTVGLGRRTSVFAHTLRPGVAVAWEPSDAGPGMDGMSFGQHRASIVAGALIDCAVDSLALEDHLRNELVKGNVDPLDLSRNLDSPHLLTAGEAGGEVRERERAPHGLGTRGPVRPDAGTPADTDPGPVGVVPTSALPAVSSRRTQGET